MRRLRLVGLALVLLGVLAVTSIQAASPPGVNLTQVEIFRHLIETDDMLILARLAMTPITESNASDTFPTVDVTGQDFDDPIVLTNRVHVTGGTDYIVIADFTDITVYCGLESDDQTINCTGTGLGNGTYSVEVTYRTGWLAYSNTDVLVRLKRGAILVAERTAPSIGYQLVGIYLTASQVTTASITWPDATITLNAEANAALWGTPGSSSISSITWQGDADHAALITTLTSRLRIYLTMLEVEDEDIASGEYVQPLGITAAGKSLAVNAYSLMAEVIPEAFLDTEFQVMPTPIAEATTQVVATIEAGVSGTLVNLTMRSVSGKAPTMVTLLASLIAAVGLYMGTKSSVIAGMAWFAVMIAGWVLFGIPYSLIMIPAGLVIAGGFMWIARGVYT